MREGLSYDDVLLIPKRGVLDQRKDANISSQLVGDWYLDLPFLSAPMTSVTETEMAIAMAKLGAIGVLHRFCTIDEQNEMYLAVREAGYDTLIALGLHDGIERAQQINTMGTFVLDIAHAHTDVAINYVSKFKEAVPTARLIVGNIATAEAALELEEAGADALKVGIGPGAACTTRIVTGFGVPQLTAIMDVRDNTNLPIIADGGIKNSGDVVKAIAAGADTVMLGSLLAGADESPLPGHYWGMASKKVNGHHAPEGIEGIVPLTGPVEDTINQLAWGLRSGVSYAGARNIDELQEYAEFMRVSPLAQIETSTRF